MADTLDLAEYDAKMQSLLEAFEAHPENQPPTPNPSIFFLHDFLRNSYNQLKAIDATKYAAGDNAAQEAVQEVVGRNCFAKVIINDTSGKLSVMVGGSAPVDFGPDIKEKVRALID